MPARPAPAAPADPTEPVVERDLDSFFDEDGGLRKGTRVRHERFGIGSVIVVDTASHPPRATVYFSSWGEKKVLLEHLRPL